jgi:galactose mutarotase-like enzyme
MDGSLRIGGAPVVTLHASDPPAHGPAFLEATVLPGRGMMLLQARVRLAGGGVVDALHAPSPADAARVLDGGPEDFNGNQSFSFGGAVLAPFVNRIRGRAVEGSREIEATVAGQLVRLPRNWGGRAAHAAQYAMHGLILAASVPWRQDAPDRIGGHLDCGDFAGHWPGKAALDIEWRLIGGELSLRVVATNAGAAPLPMGLGWHPYFALPSGDRRQARLHIPARTRAAVNNYDEVLPTGALEAAAGPYDFSGPSGRALGGLYLDDCFTDLDLSDGVVAEVLDPVAAYGLRITSRSPVVRAVQVYAPPDKAFAVIEPQTHLADPYGAEWRGRDTGMVELQAGETLAYDVTVSPFTIGNR